MPVAHVNGVDLAYTVQGHGAPLILVMGLGGPRGAWAFQSRAFGQRYQVITFDNRGIGGTASRGAPYTVSTMAADTVGLMDALGIDQAHLLGYSLGGIVAQEVAIGYPDRLQKLILAATTPVGPNLDDAISHVQAAVGLEGVASSRDLASTDLSHLMPTLVDLAFGNPVYRAILKPLSRLYARRLDTGDLARQLGAPAAADTLSGLAAIRAPTLVITGTRDRVIPPYASEVLASRIPSARLVRVEGGSHALLIEMPRRFNKHVLDFLEEAT